MGFTKLVVLSNWHVQFIHKSVISQTGNFYWQKSDQNWAKSSPHNLCMMMNLTASLHHVQRPWNLISFACSTHQMHETWSVAFIRHFFLTDDKIWWKVDKKIAKFCIYQLTMVKNCKDEILMTSKRRHFRSTDLFHRFGR